MFKTLEIIENQIAEKLSVEKIASGAFFSKFHYQRLFREIVGETVMAYVTKRRLTLAAKKLRETNAPVLNIALEFGFESHEGFTRSFKAFTGATPSNYRKFRLTAIKNEKGRMHMNSKTTNEIIRELNDLIVTARKTATAARRENTPVWTLIADKTDELAARVGDVLARVEAIAENPDEITRHFSLMTALGDVAFNTNLMALNVALTVFRGHDDEPPQKFLSNMYYKLAKITTLKESKVVPFFNELSALIFEDMRKTASEKVAAAIRAGENAAASFSRHGNIKFEVGNLIAHIRENPPHKASTAFYDDCRFRLDILMSALEVDMLAAPQSSDAQTLTAMSAFRESLSDAIDFLYAITKPDTGRKTDHSPQRKMRDLAFQGNILLFYTRGEIEKSGNPAAAFEEITAKIDAFNKAAHTAADNNDIKILREAAEELPKISTALKKQGGAFIVLAQEITLLAKRAVFP